MDATKRYDRLVDETPSAKLVYKVLELDASLTHGEITDAAVLPTRTTSYALSRLRDAGIIGAVPCTSDPRKRNYRPLPHQKPRESAAEDDAAKETSRATEETPVPPEESPVPPNPVASPGQSDD